MPDRRSTIQLVGDVETATLPFKDVKQDYDAVGDGTTDDTAAIQAAITGGGTIYFPPGTYKITSSLTFSSGGFSLIGNNPGGNGTSVKTILLFTATSGSMFKSANQSSTSYPWIRIADLMIDSSTATGNASPIVDLTSCAFVTIERVFFYGIGVASGVAVLLAEGSGQSSYYNTIKECYFGNHYYGVKFGSGGNSSRVFNCRFNPLTGGAGVYVGAANHVAVYSNVFEGGSGKGVELAATADTVSISDSRFESLPQGAITIASGAINTYIAGNYYSSATISDSGTRTVIHDAGAPGPMRAGAPYISGTQTTGLDKFYGGSSSRNLGASGGGSDTASWTGATGVNAAGLVLIQEGGLGQSALVWVGFSDVVNIIYQTGTLFVTAAAGNKFAITYTSSTGTLAVNNGYASTKSIKVTILSITN